MFKKINTISSKRYLSLAAVMVLFVQPVVVDASGFVDPTRPSGFVAARAVDGEQFRLQSVLAGSGRKLAIINGNSYSEGDRMALGEVVSISADRVVIRGSREHVLRLGAAAVKSAADSQ